MTLLTIRQTAKQEHIPESFVRRLVKSGKAPGIYSGNRFYVNCDMLAEILGTSTSKREEAQQA